MAGFRVSCLVLRVASRGCRENEGSAEAGLLSGALGTLRSLGRLRTFSKLRAFGNAPYPAANTVAAIFPETGGGDLRRGRGRAGFAAR